MQFVKTEDLKAGMRLARPIYNNKGILLFERDSRLSQSSISNVKSLGLIGLYILEPAEPVPPMTEEDMAFERFQTMTVFSLKEELGKLLAKQKQAKLRIIVDMLLKNYGHLGKKNYFSQNLRSREDYVYKHALNTAILCTMMTHVMNVKLDEQQDTLVAALVHDVGKVSLMPKLIDGDPMSQEERRSLTAAEVGVYGLIEEAYVSGPAVRRICAQSQQLLEMLGKGVPTKAKLMTGAKILAVAGMFDQMTAMKLGSKPTSEVQAIKYLMEHPQTFAPEVVQALIESIYILEPGISVELNTGEKALVVASNPNNVLRPTVLTFRDNTIVDLSNMNLYDDLEIVDVMKTLDNRYLFEPKTMPVYGENKQCPISKKY